jgi:alanyl-tRNA synthetase
MGEEICTIDLEGAGFDETVARQAEELANATIFANLPVSVRLMPVDEVEASEGLELRRAIPAGVTEARLVEVEKFDVIPCCGTHVSSTGQLGLIKILKSEKVRGQHRVYFKVGWRALGDYKDKHEIVHGLGKRLTTSSADITAKVDKLLSQGQQVRKETKKISAALAEYESVSLLREAGEQGTSVIVRYFADRDDAYLRVISTALKRQPAIVAILGAATGGVVCSASDGVAVDFTNTAVEPVRAAGGSGGGKGAYAQLKLPDGADVEKYLEEIAENVRNDLQ